MSQDPAMIQAYKDGKDLYAVIAEAMFNTQYEDNREFYEEFTEVELDGRKSIAGSGKEMTFSASSKDNYIDIPACYLVNTDQGELPCEKLTIKNKLVTDIGFVNILNICDCPNPPTNKTKYLRIFLKI